MTDPAAHPLDDLDRAILDGIAAAHTHLDPPPPELDELVHFALALDRLELDVARRGEDALVGSGARGTERTRTITFEADSRTVMITILERADGLVRLDGWLAPAAALRVELRFPEPDPPRLTAADETGRFVFDDVRRGLAQLLIHPAEEAGACVVTPSLAL
jgi:hypothetical protein